jgi:hypothetical protein
MPIPPSGTSAPAANGKGIVIGVAGGAITVVILLVVIAKIFNGGQPTLGGPDGAVVGTTATTVDTNGTSPDKTPDERVQDALSLLDKGDYASGIEQLKRVDQEVSGRKDVHKGLLRAYLAVKKPEDAMKQAQELLKIDPDSVNDRELRIAVLDTAIRANNAPKEASEMAWGLLEKHMDAIGLTDLFDFAYGPSADAYPEATRRAQTILMKGDVRGRMPPALLLNVEIMNAGVTCNLKRYLEKSLTDGDKRTRDILRSIKLPPRPPGTKKDPLACIRDDYVKAQRTLENKFK